MGKENDLFNRERLLLGNDAINAIQSKRVILFGVGGVGSWCAESNPDAQINAVKEIYSAENDPMFQLETYDYIIDAIDSLEHKVSLILRATECNGKLFSAMGAALKMDPTKVEVAEFWKVQGCPLARAVRINGTVAHITAIFGFTLAGLIIKDITQM